MKRSLGTHRLCLFGLGIVLAGCGAGAPTGTAAPPSATTASNTAIAPPATATAPATARPTPTATRTQTPFPTEAFADISADAVSEEAAAEFQAILDEAHDSRPGGITSTVMTSRGTWTGAVGTADGVRAMRADDQLAIGSVTKSVIAAQVMQLVEAGELALGERAAGYLPADFDFDTNDATISDLLGMRSGIPDYVDAVWTSLSTDPQLHWTPTEMLELVAAHRSAPGGRFEYSSTNYVLLGLIIEQVRGRPLAEVLRAGVLSADGLERLIFQPDQAPSQPMAMPGGRSIDALEAGGGYLPSLAGVTAAFSAGAMASDSASLARWWSGLCGGDIVSDESLTEMTTFSTGATYGLGISNETEFHRTPAIGHGGIHVGFAASAVCFVEDGSVVVVLTNREVGGDGDLDAAARVADALAVAARSLQVDPI